MTLMAADQRAAGVGKRMEAFALTLPLFVVTLGVGWLIWSVVEWRRGRTPSYRLVGLRVVRSSDGRPIRLTRSLARCTICLVLVAPTVAVCCVVGFCFLFGASAPDDLFHRSRTAPWDYLTGTKVVDDGPAPSEGNVATHGILETIDLSRATRPSGTQNNGHSH
jgi:hypothetical protein